MTLNAKALEALKNNQRQLDMDGVEVGVSRQALEELIAAYEALSHQQGEAVPVGWIVTRNGKMYLPLLRSPEEADRYRQRNPDEVLQPLYASPVPADAGEPAAILTLAAMWRSGAFENDADAAAQDKADETPSGEAVDASLIIEAWLDNLPRERRIRSALHPSPSPVSAPVGELERKAKAFDACGWYWPEDDTSSEACADNPFEVLENCDALDGEIVAVSRGGVVETRFYASLPPADDSDSDDTFDVDEPTQQAAEAKIAAERARRAAHSPAVVEGK